MKIFTVLFFLIILSACGRNANDTNDTFDNNTNTPHGEAWVNIDPIPVVRVQGGSNFSENMSNLYGTPIVVQDFYIGQFQVTQREWLEIMEENPSLFQGESFLDHPVERVSWYDAIVFLNRRSEIAGLQPFYNIDMYTLCNALYIDPLDEDIDTIRWTITTNPSANGYRLPTEIEWEYAAGGGQLTRNYEFSGSNDLNEVGFTFRNSGDEFLDGLWHWPTLEANNGRTHPVGSLAPNELGIYDMSGNVREWIYNWHQPEALTPATGYGRSVRGGSWVAGEDAARVDFRNYLSPHFYFEELGFRVARNA